MSCIEHCHLLECTWPRRAVATSPIIASRHRIAAAKSLGWEKIDTIEFDGSSEEAEMWEIAENLHRFDLTKEERGQQIRRYAELLTGQRQRENQATQFASPEIGYKKPPEQTLGVASIIATETGLSKDTVRRALNPERVQAEHVRSKIDADVKSRAAREVAEMLAEHIAGEWWDALKANLYAAGASNIAAELTNITGQSVMDRRFA